MAAGGSRQLAERARHVSRTAFVTCAAMAALMVAAAAPAQAEQMAGVQTHLLWGNVTSQDVERQLDQLDQAGADIIRVDVGWASLQSEGKHQYEQWVLDRLDRVVAEAETRGIELVLTVTDTPCWASSAPASLKQDCSGSWWSRDVQRYPPVDPQDYADGFAHLVDRYRGRIAAWEIWNEPNSDYYFRSGSAATYAGMVRAAYNAAKRVDPNATILAGALSESDYRFTQALFDHGIKGHFDGFSMHPYSNDRSPLYQHPDPRYSFASGVPAVRDVLVRNGYARPLWLTEFGWQTSTIRGQEAWMNGVSEWTQGCFIKQAYDRMQSWDYVKAAFVYELNDESNDPHSRNANFGLLEHDGEKKPGYRRFRKAAAAVEAREPVPMRERCSSAR
jgi:hypothetical protein